MSQLPWNERQQVLDADEVLLQAQELVARDASERTDTWQRVHGRMLGLRASRSKKALSIQWRRVALVAASLALGAVFPSTPSARRLLMAVLSPGEVAVKQAAAKVRLAMTPSKTTAVAEAGHDSLSEQTGQLRDGWTEVDLQSVGRLFAAPNAVFHLPNGSAVDGEPSYTVVLDSGELCAQVWHRDVASQGPFVVQAPGMRAVAVGTRFCVFAASMPTESWVVVEEGRVRVEQAGGESTLAGAGVVVRAVGESVVPSSAVAPAVSLERAPPRKASATRQSSPPAGSACLGAPAEERERCLWRQAGGAGFAAQNALYLLGVMARDEQHDGRVSLSIWRTYQHRFPQGVLAVEASWNIFDELVAERRFDEALSSSEEFIKSHGDFFRSGELRLRRAEILRDSLGRAADAEVEYQQVLSRESRVALRDEALFGLGRCQERLNQQADAHATFELYRREFPAGKHRTEVARRFGTDNDTRQR